MKTIHATQLVSHLALAVILTALAGCASSNYEKGTSTAAGLTDSANRITAGKAKIDGTLAALNDLVNNPQGDLVPKFKKYTEAVSDLQSSAQDVSEKVADMRTSGNAYLKAWDEQLAQIQNEDIKKRSADRKAEVQKKLTVIKKSYVEGEVAFKPFMASLKDIQTALSTDLTAGGVSSVKGAADKANQDGQKVKAIVDQLTAEFNELGVSMASSTTTK